MSCPTVVYTDAAAKGLTLREQNHDAIDNLTRWWIPPQQVWDSEAADHTRSRFTITSVTVPDYWANAVANGTYRDPGLHMERVMGVLTQTYDTSDATTGSTGSSAVAAPPASPTGTRGRGSTSRAVVIDLGLLCGPPSRAAAGWSRRRNRPRSAPAEPRDSANAGDAIVKGAAGRGRAAAVRQPDPRARRAARRRRRHRRRRRDRAVPNRRDPCAAWTRPRPATPAPSSPPPSRPPSPQPSRRPRSSAPNWSRSSPPPPNPGCTTTPTPPCPAATNSPTTATRPAAATTTPSGCSSNAPTGDRSPTG